MRPSDYCWAVVLFFVVLYDENKPQSLSSYIQMKKIIDFEVRENRPLSRSACLLKLSPTDGCRLPECRPGQFVEVKIPAGADVLLRRPISINFVDPETKELWLLVRAAGRGTEVVCGLPVGSCLNIVMPLGNGFTIPSAGTSPRLLLVGGGVGVAPLLHLGHELRNAGFDPHFLLGARTEDELLERELFEALGTVSISTDDGSCGVKGVVTDHDVWESPFDMVYCCGPAPMMKAVARKSREKGVACEVSLENMMACGLGACLCCVEPTVKGNVCVCTDGPVFNIDSLLW